MTRMRRLAKPYHGRVGLISAGFPQPIRLPMSIEQALVASKKYYAFARGANTQKSKAIMVTKRSNISPTSESTRSERSN